MNDKIDASYWTLSNSLSNVSLLNSCTRLFPLCTVANYGSKPSPCMTPGSTSKILYVLPITKSIFLSPETCEYVFKVRHFKNNFQRHCIIYENRVISKYCICDSRMRMEFCRSEFLTRCTIYDLLHNILHAEFTKNIYR